jgi:hypothetical protein
MNERDVRTWFWIAGRQKHEAELQTSFLASSQTVQDDTTPKKAE